LARCLLALALTSWDAAVAALRPMKGSDDSPTDGVTDTAGESDPGRAADEAGGAYVIDISDPVNPREVSFIAAFQGSFVGEGVHAVHIDTRSFTGDILAVNDEICGAGGLGGVSLWDITNPLTATLLAQDFGDTYGRARQPDVQPDTRLSIPARSETPGTLSPTLATSAQGRGRDEVRRPGPHLPVRRDHSAEDRHLRRPLPPHQPAAMAVPGRDRGHADPDGAGPRGRPTAASPRHAGCAIAE